MRRLSVEEIKAWEESDPGAHTWEQQARDASGAIPELGSDPTEQTYESQFHELPDGEAPPMQPGDENAVVVEAPNRDVSVGTPSQDEAPAGERQPMPSRPRRLDPTKERTISDEEAQGWWSDPIMSTRAFLDGIAFGGADELGAMVAASMATVLNGADYGETYSDMVDVLEMERKKFAASNPAANIGLNIAGGILSPINVLGGAAITGRVGSVANSSSKLAKPLKTAAEKIAKASGTTEGATALAKAARTATVAGAEGAVAGAASAEQGERLEGAAYGTLFGVGGSALLSGAGQALNIPMRRHVKQDLVTPEGRMPLNLAANRDGTGSGYERFLQLFYHRVVGGGWGSGTKLIEQSAPWLQRAKTKAKDVDELLKEAVKRTNRAATQLGKRYTRKTRDAKTAVRRQSAEEIDKARAVDAAKKQYDVDMKAAATAENNLKRVAHDETKRKMAANAASQASDIIDDAQEGFRRAAVNGSKNSGMKAKDVARLDEALTKEDGMQEALSILDNHWRKNGFDYIKNKKFNIAPARLQKALEDAASEGDGLLPIHREAISEAINDFTANVMEGQGNWHTGESLTQLRRYFGDKASALFKADKAMEARVYKDVQKALDDLMMPRLKQLKLDKRWKEDREAWRNLLTYRRASQNAANKRGNFTTDDWRTAGKTVDPVGTGRGTGPLQKTADQVDSSTKQLQKEIDNIYENLREEYIDEAVVQATRDKNKMERLVRESKMRRDAAIDEITRQGDDARDRIPKMQRERQRHKELEAELETAQKALEEITALVPRKGQSLFEKNFATGITGAVAQSIVGATLSVGDAMAWGIGINRLLAGPLMQDLLAGQTKFQNVASRYLTGAYGAHELGRAATRGTTMHLNTNDMDGQSLYERTGGSIFDE